MPRAVTRVVIAVEVPPHARPHGFVYVHDAQLDGDEDLAVGTRVEIQDEGGFMWAATVDEITAERVGRRYRLRLGA